MAATRAGLCFVLSLASVVALNPPLASAEAARASAAGIEGLLDQVVNIFVTSYAVTSPPASNMAGQAAIAPTKNRAAGFIVDRSGIIVTNRHSVAGAAEIVVVLHDTTRLRATLLATAPHTDIALLKVNAHRALPTARFGDSEKLRPGDPVLLIGIPLGLGSTITSGIVSALDRNTEESGSGSFFQIDAALNRGNSGGPVFNADGEVVGIATALLSASGLEGSVGLGFAIPSNDAIAVVRSLLEHGEVRTGWIGAHVERLTADTAAALGLPTTDGSIVVDVAPDSPAWRSGLTAGDVILEVDGLTYGSPRVLNRKVGQSPIGAGLAITLWRDGASSVIPVTVAEAPATVAGARPAVAETRPRAQVEDAYLGLVVGPLTADLQRKFARQATRRGVVVAAVTPRSIADDHGIVAGSIILNIDRHDVTSVADVKQSIDTARTGKRAYAMLLIEDEQGLHWVALPVRSGSDAAAGGTR